MIIHSLLDTDLYKFTMMQVVLHQFPEAHAEYRFQCRTRDVDLRPVRADLERELEHLCSLRLEEDELAYLGSLRYIKEDFVEFLRLFRLQSRFVHIGEKDGQLDVVIRGPWLHTILFEVPLLALISEIHHRHAHPDHDLIEGRRRLRAKIDYLKGLDDDGEFIFSDFGTRRRFSRAWQDEVVLTLHRQIPEYMRGTSNVRLARELDITPIGTMAHEFVQAAQALGPKLSQSQVFAFESWAKEYRGDLGIALSDTYSRDAFLRDFDMYFCKLFDGARQDSGDPIEWGEALIGHYKRNRVNPATKNMVFSDSLDMERAVEIWRHFRDRIRVSFGIGTHLTCDLDVDPINIVIKMTGCNGQPVVKLSDSPGKIMSTDDKYLEWVREAFEVGSGSSG